MVLLLWLGRTRWGRSALGRSDISRYKITAEDVFLAGGLYLLAMVAGALVLSNPDEISQPRQDLGYLLVMLGQLAVCLAVVMIGRRRFGGSWGSFGLGDQSWEKTMVWTAIYFVVATGLTLLTLWLTLEVCAVFGYDEVHKHTFLEELSQKPPPRTIILLFVTAVPVAPLTEELLFRALLQNFLIGTLARKKLKSESQAIALDNTDQIATSSATAGIRWMGILLTAFIFAIFHQTQHTPALFVLGICLGYSYERHRNLLIPILIHCGFNLMPLLLTVLKYY